MDWAGGRTVGRTCESRCLSRFSAASKLKRACWCRWASCHVACTMFDVLDPNAKVPVARYVQP